MRGLQRPSPGIVLVAPNEYEAGEDGRGLYTQRGLAQRIDIQNGSNTLPRPGGTLRHQSGREGTEAPSRRAWCSPDRNPARLLQTRAVVEGGGTSQQVLCYIDNKVLFTVSFRVTSLLLGQCGLAIRLS